tara:strand:+ start:108 stop:329 length:222 start_codon:yes stop_codon:yes gene_type:complete
MTKIIIFVLACTGCQLEKLEFTFDDNKYDWCSDHAQVIIEDMSTFYWYKEGVYEHSAYYTNDGNKLVVGHRCE